MLSTISHFLYHCVAVFFSLILCVFSELYFFARFDPYLMLKNPLARFEPWRVWTTSLIKCKFWPYNCYSLFLFKKYWANPGLFLVYFRYFQTQFLYRKTCRLQRDSNSDCRKKASTLATWPPNYHAPTLCSLLFLQILSFFSILIFLSSFVCLESGNH